MAPLKATLILSLNDNIFKSSEMGPSSYPVFHGGLPRGALAEHAALLKLLSQEGVRLLDVLQLTDEAIVAARQKGELAPWLEAHFPATAPALLQHLDELTADSIFYRRDDHFYLHNSNGQLDPLFPGISSMYWSRDFAASTPRGIVIGNGVRYGRSLENAIARLIFRHSATLSDFKVVFDAQQEGVLLDGGDIIVLNDKTLLVGVGNRSSLEAAPRLAQRLNMDVLAVSMPPADEPNGLRRQLLHLDSTFNLVGNRTILAMPFFLEKQHSDSNPVISILLGLSAQMERLLALRPELSIGDPYSVKVTAQLAPQVGWLTRYSAGSGRARELGIKLVDYFRQEGYTVVYVGGDPGGMPLEKYALERAMYELRWQGANVVQLAPGRVIAYQHNIYTNEALRQAGIEVLTFPGELLAMRGGGPHCLLMPLVRGPKYSLP